jgi:Na+/melibiose symporter-like transporter
MLSPFIFKNIDKVKGFKISMAIEAALLIGMYFPAGNVAAIFALVIIINIIQLAATPLQWSMLSDIIDAEENAAVKSSAGSFFQQTCLPSSWGSPSAARWWAICWHGATTLAAQRSKPTPRCR